MKNLGETIKQQRIEMSLTLRELAATSGTSASHLGRIERGERFPSAHILRKIAKPLSLKESELFALAGFLSPDAVEDNKERPAGTFPGLDPYVAKILAEEPLEIQRYAIVALALLQSIGRSLTREERNR